MAQSTEALASAADWSWHKDRFEETFGARLPGRFRANWPTGKRIAVLLTFDTQGDIDAAVRGYQGTTLWPGGLINYCDLTMRQYDIYEGVPRVLRILRKYDVRATFPISGVTAEWYPDMVREVAAEGHEVAAHGHRHVPMVVLDEAEQRCEVELATEAIEKTAGVRPTGWRCPMYSITAQTLDDLAALGYIWDSDFHDRDFPYVIEKKGRTKIVEIPAGNDDWSLYIQLDSGQVQMGGTPYGTSDGVFSTLKSEFDILYEESRDEPRMFQFCMHPKISGRPCRAAVLDRLIAYIRAHDGVWFASCGEIASLA